MDEGEHSLGCPCQEKPAWGGTRRKGPLDISYQSSGTEGTGGHANILGSFSNVGVLTPCSAISKSSILNMCYIVYTKFLIKLLGF